MTLTPSKRPQNASFHAMVIHTLFLSWRDSYLQIGDAACLFCSALSSPTINASLSLSWRSLASLLAKDTAEGRFVSCAQPESPRQMCVRVGKGVKA